MKGHRIRRPAGLPDAEVFGRARPALAEWHPEGGKFGLTPPGPYAGNEASAGHLVQRGHHFGRGHRIAIWHNEHGGAEADTGRARRYIGQDNQRIVGIAPGGESPGGAIDDNVIIQ